MAREVKKSVYRKAKSARTVSISQTKWQEKVAGKKGQAGRLYGPKGKRFTGTVDLGGGRTAVYKEGKRVTRRKTAGGGVTTAQANAARRNAGGASAPASTPKTTRTGFSSSAANRGGYSAAGYIRRLKPTTGGVAGSGRDNVNAASSGGSAKTSTARDSFVAEQGARARSPLGRGRQRLVSNKPFRGERSRLQRDKSGQMRWVRAVK